MQYQRDPIVRGTARREGEPRGGPARPPTIEPPAGAAPRSPASRWMRWGWSARCSARGAGAGAARPDGKQATCARCGALHEADPAVRPVGAEVGALERQTIPALAGALAGELRGARAAARGAGGCRIGGPAEDSAPRVEETRLQRDVTLAEQAVVNLQQRYGGGTAGGGQQPVRRTRVGSRRGAADAAGSLGPILSVLAMIGGLGLVRGRGAARPYRPPRASPRPRHAAHGTGDPRRGAARGLAQTQT